MEIWAKKKKDHNREYRSVYKVVNIKLEDSGYVFVCDVPAVIRDLKIRYKFVDCENPIKEKKVVEQPEKEQVEQPKRKRRK